MKADSRCITCMLSKQQNRLCKFNDEKKKSEYMQKAEEFLKKNAPHNCGPWLSSQLRELYGRYWGDYEDFTEAKHKYNMLLIRKEAELTEKISLSPDPVKESIKYVCAANYIDFSAVADVNESTFESLLKKAETEKISDEEYGFFKADLEKAQTLAYITDNCGEIAVDKIFIKFLKKAYPKLNITVVVRGQDTINDATLKDAEEVGLTEIVKCIGNGNAAPGTVLKELSKEARDCIFNADIVISKGQGNFESLFCEGLNPYYMFLCKCDLFVERFGIGKFSSVFMKEERIRAFR